MFSACIIVKNEEEYIGRLLSSLEGCTDIVVVDTGSTDRTLEVVAGFPGVRIQTFPWTDSFSEARNAAATYARHDWIAWPDADMYFPPGEVAKILGLIPRLPANVDGIALKIVDKACAFPSPRIYRKGRRFQGRVHEDCGCKCVIQTPFVLHVDRVESVEDRRVKDARYEQLLLSEYEGNPKSTHALMYLRDLAFNRRDYAKTRQYVEKMLALENDYLCHHYLACIAREERKPAEALEHGFRALRSSCTDPRVYVLIADAYDELGKKIEALVFYELARRLPAEARLVGTKYPIAEDDYGVVPLTNMAKVFLDMGQREKALACYEEALGQNPQPTHRAAIEQNIRKVKAKPSPP